MTVRALFLDRDGTIIEDVGHVDDPDRVRLLPGAAEAIRRCSDAGYLVVVVSNQSGVARGLFDETTLASVHARMEELLQELGARLDGAYYCPSLSGPEAKIEAYRRDSDLRKPQSGMLRQAARALNIDLSQSWMIGDSPTDVEAGRRAGCRTILLARNGTGTTDKGVKATHMSRTLLEACTILERDMKAEHVEPSPKEPRTDEDEIPRLLNKICDQLDRAHRQERQHDFSVVRLFGALLQMFAIMTVLWGIISLLNDQTASATARFMLACFFQLASFCTFTIDRSR